MPFVKLANGIVAHVRMSPPRRRRCKCGRRSEWLCDHPVRAPHFEGEEVKACSEPLCSGCTTKVGDDVDYCPKHAGKAEPPQPKQGGLAL